MLSLGNFILILITICVHGLKVSDSPDITLLSRLTNYRGNIINNIVCVAGDNARDSAITFIAPLGPNYWSTISAKSTYFHTKGQYLPDEYDCDFEPMSNCSTTWFRREGHKFMTSTTGKHDLDLVTDERWEKFSTKISQNGKFEKYIFKHELPKVSVGISVRTQSEINIIFCDVKVTNKCYWVIISKIKSTLLSCNLGNRMLPVYEKSEYKKITNGKGLSVSELYWSHFKLSISSEGTIIIKNQDTLLQSIGVSQLKIKELLLMSIDKGFWKIHDYNYLSLLWHQSPTSWIYVGPELQSDNTGLLCVELYVAICSWCKLNLRFDIATESVEIYGNSSQGTQKWQLQRLKMRTTQSNQACRILVKYDGGDKGFWLIDDIRRCHDQETRIITLTAVVKTTETVSCQALKQPDRWSTIKSKVNHTDLVVCDNATYTGSNCGVSCKVALGTDCSKVTVCEPSTSRDAPKCTCAAGYHGDQCQDECEKRFYGSGCKKICTPCKEFCLKPSGACPYYRTCLTDDTDPGCLIDMNSPRNLNITWIQDRAQVRWDHPKMNNYNSEISFIIYIQLMNTELITSPNYSFMETYTETKTRNHYSFEVPDDLPLSSSYLIEVQTNAREGSVTNNKASIIVSSPAVTPQFADEVTNGERTNVTQRITIPAAESGTLTKNSLLYVFVCNFTSADNPPNSKYKLHSQLYSWVQCQGNSWIAATLKPTDKSMDFIVGDSKIKSENKQLTPDLPYNINIIFVNEYKADIKYAITSTVTSDLSSGFNNGLYALLLLLLIIPAIAWFIYRKNKVSIRAKEVAVSYHVVNTQPVISLVNIAEENNVKTKSNSYLKNESLEQNDKQLISEALTLIKSNGNKENKQLYSKIVNINNFSNYVKQSLANGELEKQFELFPKGRTKPWVIGTLEENIFKNRYKNITAYDHSRVILEEINGEPHSNFINANYIDGYNQQKAYIATQGPKKCTVNDFWRMIWQEDTVCIVMITNLIENGKVKCEKYWPDINETTEYGMIQVTFLDVDTYADFEYRTFKVQKDNIIRKIQQYHFTSWPDHGVPLYPQSLVPFLNKLLTISPAEAPIVVHCSAGIGRTGTIILTDICLRMAAKENKIDVLKYFNSMREQRVNMVAEYDQYELVHMALLECLVTPKSSYPCHNLTEIVEELINKGKLKEQMQHLKNTSWYNHVSGVHDLEPDAMNNSKNRFFNIVPTNRIYLSKYNSADESSDYINAVSVDGFRHKGQFIVTQNPLPNTIQDFWQLISEYNINVIISLNEIMAHDKTCSKFWPLENEEITPLPYLKVTCQSKIDELDYEITKIKLQNSRNTGDIKLKYVNIMHIKNWKYAQLIPANEDQLIGLIEAALKLPVKDSPVVVTCYDGARASGLYVALSFIIEKIKLEQVCDVCLAVRTVRKNREQFISDIEQFEFLYKAAVQYISKFENYSNFDVPRKQ